jgi:DNA-binding beta-propeller fold protein YncE
MRICWAAARTSILAYAAFAAIFGSTILFLVQSTGATTLADGMNASDLAGQADFTSSTTGATSATMTNPLDTVIDVAGHRLFVADSGNNRVLVFDLDASNNLSDRVPDHVLGQTGFTTNATALTQTNLFNPRGLAYDSLGNRLFVANDNHRVMVFDVAAITDGEEAVGLLGQSNFSTANAATSQSGLNAPVGLAYVSAGNRLFVTDAGNNRVMVFDVATTTPGEAAVNVLGQPTFTSNSSAATQSGLNLPEKLAYDVTANRLFVSDKNNHRVMVFDLATITNGEDAFGQLGQTSFFGSNAGTSASGLNTPNGLVYRSSDSRLFVADSGNHRVLVFDAATTTPAEAALNVLGQTSFTTNAAATTQAGMRSPKGLAYDSTKDRLYVADSQNHRVTVFNLSAAVASTAGGTSCPAPSIALGSPNGGGTYDAGQQVFVFWTANGCQITGVTLSLSLDGGATYPTVIASGVNPAGGYYAWTIPRSPTAAARIRLDLLGQGGGVLMSDASDANFTIVDTSAPASPEPPAATAPPPDTSATSTEPAPPPPVLKPPCFGGILIKAPSNSAVYYCAKTGRRFVFPTQDVFFSWFRDFSTVKTIPPEEMLRIPIGGNITYKPGTSR